MLRLDGHGYSPPVLEKVVTAGGEFSSYARAARMLKVLAEIDISAMQVARLTQEVGEELTAVRDQQAEAYRKRTLPSSAQTAVEIACVEMDGGRIRTRAEGEGVGVHDPQWKETKVACLWRMKGPVFEEDPQPEPPRCFTDPEHVVRLVREIKNTSSPHDDALSASAAAAEKPRKARRRGGAKTDRPWPPRRLFRTCVASRGDVHAFGPLVAAEAHERGFFQASRQVFLGDGDHKNWTLHRTYFPHFTPVTDFVHVVSYLYEAAGAITSSFAAQWEQYVEWLRACWQGRVAAVLVELRSWLDRLGKPPDTPPPNDPGSVVARTITYLENNQARMNYPAYRQQGLPVTSSLVESLIKQFNQRVKGSEKFWNRTRGAEAILQVRAALLCDDDRLAQHLRSRPGRLHRRQRPASTRATG
jgi:hypothetical protein